MDAYWIVALISFVSLAWVVGCCVLNGDRLQKRVRNLEFQVALTQDKLSGLKRFETPTYVTPVDPRQFIPPFED
jgi:Tfp pilus assembly protein PilP